MQGHISYSEFKDWHFCPYYHHLRWRLKLDDFKDSVFSVFGGAAHKYLEYDIIGESSDFRQLLTEGYEVLPETDRENKKAFEEFVRQGEELLPLVIPALKKKFGEYELIGKELDLYLPAIDGMPEDYKGFIDLVIKTKDGRYKIIDYKSCSWGWDANKKSDKFVLYQLIFYKHYFAKKYDIDISLIDVYFVLLKRTCSTKKEKIEIFEVTSGKVRIKNALELLSQAIRGIQKEMKIKKRTNCAKCKFNNTEHCKK